MEPTAAPDVLLSMEGRVGRIILNPPRSINALTTGMVEEIERALTSWRHARAVEVVAVTGSGERGLCAGGDIVALYGSVTSDDGSDAERFFRAEYRLNAMIARYPKPYVAIMDGIVLGGGIGISAHGSVRVVTERSSLGMPETAIGFTPDVGGTWLLAHAPGELGTMLALTGAKVGPGDAIALGLADRFVPSVLVNAFLDAIDDDGLDAALASFAQSAPASTLLADQEWIDRAFSADNVPEIIDRLRDVPHAAARRMEASLAAASPTALAVTLESMRRVRRVGSLEEALRQEFAVSLHTMLSADFAEGVRAQLIDKDRAPRWQPAPTDVSAYFELGDASDLSFA